jgi:hypothetical protein
MEVAVARAWRRWSPEHGGGVHRSMEEVFTGAWRRWSPVSVLELGGGGSKHGHRRAWSMEHGSKEVEMAGGRNRRSC